MCICKINLNTLKLLKMAQEKKKKKKKPTKNNEINFHTLFVLSLLTNYNYLYAY